MPLISVQGWLFIDNSELLLGSQAPVIAPNSADSSVIRPAIAQPVLHQL